MQPHETMNRIDENRVHRVFVELFFIVRVLKRLNWNQNCTQLFSLMAYYSLKCSYSSCCCCCCCCWAFICHCKDVSELFAVAYGWCEMWEDNEWKSKMNRIDLKTRRYFGFSNCFELWLGFLFGLDGRWSSEISVWFAGNYRLISNCDQSR